MFEGRRLPHDRLFFRERGVKEMLIGSRGIGRQRGRWSEQAPAAGTA